MRLRRVDDVGLGDYVEVHSKCSWETLGDQIEER